MMLKLGTIHFNDMREMTRNDVALEQLKLLLIMARTYLKGYPVGKYRKQAIRAIAQQVAQEAKISDCSFTSHLSESGQTDSDRYILLQRILLLTIMSKAFANGYPMGYFRKAALIDNIKNISDTLTIKTRFSDLEFFKVA